MVLVALLVGLFIVAMGMFGVAAPHGLLTAIRFVLTPLGLYLVAALRVVFGVILVLVAPSSRAPRVLRPLGLVMLVAGLTIPFFGVDRARAMLDWWSARGPAFMRVWAGLAVALGPDRPGAEQRADRPWRSRVGDAICLRSASHPPPSITSRRSRSTPCKGS